MSEEKQHNEEYKLPDAWKPEGPESEFAVPENYFSGAGEDLLYSKVLTEAEFASPPGYFSESEESIVNRAQFPDADERFFSRQEDEILRKAFSSSSMNQPEEFATPPGYFAEQEKAIVSQLAPSEKGRIIRFTPRAMLYASAAAAVVVMALFFFQPFQSGKQEFAEALNKEEIDVDDLTYIQEEEWIYDLYLDEMPIELSDTLGTDSLYFSAPDTGVSGEELDPKTGLPMKKNQNGIKPGSENDDLNWDDISDEELMLYLMEKGDEDLFEEN